MQYEYFYGAQAEQFSFYRIPKALFTEPNFRELSTDAKVLYGILLDRMSLSLKNQWLDLLGSEGKSSANYGLYHRKCAVLYGRPSSQCHQQLKSFEFPLIGKMTPLCTAL